MRNNEIIKAVAVFDLHYSKIHRPTWEIIKEFVADVQPEVFIFGGDQFHFDCISNHTEGLPLYRVEGGYMKDIEGFKEEILDPLEKLLPKGCDKRWVIGNHERFEVDYIEKNPELEGTIDHVMRLNLLGRGWKVIPLGHTTKLGKLNVIHGDILSRHGQSYMGKFPAEKAVNLFCGCVLAGHTHSPQFFTKVSPISQKEKWQGYISPTAGMINPSYLRNGPSSWMTGFNYIEIDPAGDFNYYPLLTANNKLIFQGKIYGKE